MYRYIEPYLLHCINIRIIRHIITNTNKGYILNVSYLYFNVVLYTYFYLLFITIKI